MRDFLTANGIGRTFTGVALRNDRRRSNGKSSVIDKWRDEKVSHRYGNDPNEADIMQMMLHFDGTAQHLGIYGHRLDIKLLNRSPLAPTHCGLRDCGGGSLVINQSAEHIRLSMMLWIEAKSS